MDIGTGSSNTIGKFHITISGSPMLTVDRQGDLGIGTTSPSEKLHINSGNILLSNSTLGVRLNASDSPMITRAWDLFSSGNYNGIGRWGLFMEPSTLTFGIPDLAGKKFEFARYNSNSTRETQMTIDRNGKVSRPSTGSANLLPICMGYIAANGAILSGTGNFTVVKDIPSGLTEITITGESYTNTGYITMATNVRTDGSKNFCMSEAVSGKLRIWQYDDGGTINNQDFHFVVYKLD